MTTPFCPRDDAGFCKIAELGGRCVTIHKCPTSTDEAREWLWSARQAALRRFAVKNAVKEGK
jgi:hypothetical protein